ncbi:MAG: restriction endonuclease subunit S [Verrucomicrobia bacterium]|nr:restriction endonuclease subunit S [Verrucomicrobiota bacterium]
MENGLTESTLAEVCSLVTDGTHDTPKRVASGFPLIKAKEITGGRIDFENCDQISEEEHLEVIARSKPEFGDTLFAHIGASLGEAAFVNTTREFSIKNVALFKPNPAVIDARYLYYLVTSPAFQSLAKGTKTGSAQPFLGLSQLRGHCIQFHRDMGTQRRIGAILSAYDELMENSQRRIRLLEAMARALYREWFVHFRFPGHEKLPRVASPLGDIPQGWEVKTVADSFEISGGGTPSRKEEKYWDGGTIQWFSPSNLTGAGTMFMDDSSDHITELGLAESSARLFPARCVMLTSRATIGAIAINTHEACTNQGFITCLPNERVPLYFLFHWLTENVPTFERMASGATFKEISRGVFKTIEFLQPPAELVRRFEDAAAPMAEQALALQRKIQNLRRTRDLLLPRLLSGAINL